MCDDAHQMQVRELREGVLLVFKPRIGVPRTISIYPDQ
jgi:hypothetical protein